MSGAVIDLLYGCADTPGMPPSVHFKQALAETGDGVAAEPDLRRTDSSGIDTTQVVVPEREAVNEEGISADPTAPSSDPDLWLYRDRTVALLRRYMRLSIEVGRLPSLLGREFFRTRVTSYGSSTFEDSVIFVHDVERSLEELNEFETKLIAKIVLQQFSKEEAGRLLGCGYRTVERLFPEALDRVSEILLKRGILTGLPNSKREVPKTCQGGKTSRFLASE
jgi:hypothetical protein